MALSVMEVRATKQIMRKERCEKKPKLFICLRTFFVVMFYRSGCSVEECVYAPCYTTSIHVQSGTFPMYFRFVRKANNKKVLFVITIAFCLGCSLRRVDTLPNWQTVDRQIEQRTISRREEEKKTLSHTQHTEKDKTKVEEKE